MIRRTHLNCVADLKDRRYKWKLLNFRHYLGICLEKLRKITETLNQYGRCSNRDLKPESSKHETRLRQQMSEFSRQIFVTFGFKC